MAAPTPASLHELPDRIAELWRLSHEASLGALAFSEAADQAFLRRYFGRRSRHLSALCHWLQHLPDFDNIAYPFVVNPTDVSSQSDQDLLEQFLLTNDSLMKAVDAVLNCQAAHPFAFSALSRERQELKRHRRCLLTLIASLQLN